MLSDISSIDECASFISSTSQTTRRSIQNRSTTTYYNAYQLSSFMMTSIWSQGLVVPFTLPLHNDGYADVNASFLRLRFNLYIGTVYVKQEMYSPNEDVIETILMQKTSEWRWFNVGFGTWIIECYKYLWIPNDFVYYHIDKQVWHFQCSNPKCHHC